MKVIMTGPKKKSPKKTKSPQNFNEYNNFLSGIGDTKPKIPRGDKKIVRLHRKTKSGNRQTRSKDIRDINDISMKMIQMKNNKIQVRTQNKVEEVMEKAVKKKPVKEKAVKEKAVMEKAVKEKAPVMEKAPVKEPVKEKAVKEKAPVKEKPKSLNGHRRTNTRSNTRSNKRSHKRKSTPRTRNKNRNISVKTRIFNEQDVKKVESKIKEIRSRKPEEIKAELAKQGVKVSGKSNRLLKDIYLYSTVCNINIKHEK